MKVLHYLPGRIRIRVPERAEENGTLLSRLEEDLRREKIDAKANRVTGTLLITYDPVRMQGDEVLHRLAAIAGRPLEKPEEESGKVGSAGGEDLRTRVRGLDRKLYALIEDSPELKSLIPAALLVFGLNGLLTQRPLPRIPYFLLLWWSFRSFMLFHSNERVAERIVEPAETVP